MEMGNPPSQLTSGMNDGNRNTLFGTTPTEVISAITSAFDAGATSGSVQITATSATPPITRQKLKRNRAILSCQPCHIRKQQCDRTQPCKRCVKRGTHDECVYEQPAHKSSRIKSNDGQTINDRLSVRVAQLESLVQNTLGSIEPTALVGLDALLQLVQASNAIAAPTTHLTGPGMADPNRVTDHAVQVAAAALGQLSQQNVLGGPGPAVPQPTFGPISELLSHIRTGNLQSSSNPATLADLLTHFPNHTITTRLLSHYFELSSIHWMWPVIHRPVFDSCYLTFSAGPHPPSLDFIALLAIVCASALQFLPETDEDASIFSGYEPGRHVLKKRLYEFARSVVVFSDAPLPSTERIQALILLALYQTNEGNLTDSYNSVAIAIRMAQSLAMNRDGLTWKLNPLEAEIRRRLWWMLFTLDRFQCLMLRRPYIIHDQHYDVAMPHNLDQLELRDNPELQGKPPNQPTEHAFHILQIHWTRLIGKMWDKCFALEIPTCRMIIDLEEEIRRFELDLPASFRSQSIQGALARPYLLFQNQCLTLQIYHARAILLRPFLFIKPASEIGTHHLPKLASFHRHAKVVCLMFCKRLLAWQLLIQAQGNHSQLRWSDFALRAFDAALTFAVSIIMDPTDFQNEELDEWIALAQHLLRDLGAYNIIALNAVEGLDVVRKRTRRALHPEIGFSPALPPHITTIDHLERATRTLAQPQPSISDFMDPEDTSDPTWIAEKVGVFAGHFPGIEALCGNTDPQTLENFLENCIATSDSAN